MLYWHAMDLTAAVSAFSSFAFVSSTGRRVTLRRRLEYFHDLLHEEIAPAVAMANPSPCEVAHIKISFSRAHEVGVVMVKSALNYPPHPPDLQYGPPPTRTAAKTRR